jgi:alkylation response protein AidB-like acyl-CoA dehydrogenase
VINGAKSFITNSGTAITDLITVTAVTGVQGDRKEISAIIVPAGTPGLTVSGEVLQGRLGVVGHPRPVLRRRARARAEPARRAGPRVRPVPRDPGRGPVAIAALAVGLAQGCVDESVRYARERTSFGRRIGEYQAVQFTIADMEARAHTARLAYYAAAARMLRGEPFKKEARSRSSSPRTPRWTTRGRPLRSSAATGS